MFGHKPIHLFPQFGSIYFVIEQKCCATVWPTAAIARYSVRNIIKGGGPVRLLCALVKALWQLCKQLDIQLVARWWQRRSEVDMQKADDLSKVGTLWEILPSFKARVLEQHGVLVSMPGSGRRHVQVRGLLTWQR